MTSLQCKLWQELTFILPCFSQQLLVNLKQLSPLYHRLLLLHHRLFFWYCTLGSLLVRRWPWRGSVFVSSVGCPHCSECVEHEDGHCRAGGQQKEAVTIKHHFGWMDVTVVTDSRLHWVLHLAAFWNWNYCHIFLMLKNCDQISSFAWYHIWGK